MGHCIAFTVCITIPICCRALHEDEHRTKGDTTRTQFFLNVHRWLRGFQGLAIGILRFEWREHLDHIPWEFTSYLMVCHSQCLPLYNIYKSNNFLIILQWFLHVEWFSKRYVENGWFRLSSWREYREIICRSFLQLQCLSMEWEGGAFWEHFTLVSVIIFVDTPCGRHLFGV